MKDFTKFFVFIPVFALASALTVACATDLMPAPANIIPPVETTTSPSGENDPVTPTAGAETATPISGEEGASTPEPTEEDATQTESPLEFTYDLAPVSSIEVKVADDPVEQVNVTVQGEFRDGCTQIDEIRQTMTGDTFVIEITTRRPIDMMCTQALVPFEETVELDVSGLDAGSYTVDVNGVSETFELDTEVSA